MTRRRFLRHPAKVPLYISVKGGVFQRFIELESKNLSEGGVAFETGKRIPLESNTRVEISAVEGLPRSARIEGRVVYRQKHPESGRYTIGVAFERFVNVEREELLRLFEGGEDEQQTPQATPTPA